jgi:hypothetical protein
MPGPNLTTDVSKFFFLHTIGSSFIANTPLSSDNCCCEAAAIQYKDEARDRLHSINFKKGGRLSLHESWKAVESR